MPWQPRKTRSKTNKRARSASVATCVLGRRRSGLHRWQQRLRGPRPAGENGQNEHETRTRGPRAQNTRSGRPNTRSGARGLSAMEGDLDADDDADVNFSCTSRPDAAQRSGLRARQAWSGGPAVSSSHLRSWAVNHPVPPLHRPCACLCPSQAYSPAQRARIIDPGPGRRPPGRRFALHRASGPRLRCAAPSPGPVRPLERGLLLLLRASTPGPAAASTTTPALATLRRPFPPFLPALRPFVHRFCPFRVPCLQAS